MDEKLVIEILAQVRQMAEHEGLVESTRNKKCCLLKKLLLAVPDLSKKSLEHFFKTATKRTGQPLSPHTRNTIRSELKWYFTHVCQQSLPDDWQPLLKKEPTHSPGKTVPLEALEALLDYAPSETVRMACRLLYQSGLRPHELLSLKVKHLEFHNPHVAIIDLPAENPKVPSGRNKTGARPILLNGSIVAELQQYLSRCQLTTEDFLFPFAHRSLSTIFSRMKQRYLADQPPTPSTPSPLPSVAPDSTQAPPDYRQFWQTTRLYDLRHTYATTLTAQGASEYFLRLCMGWSPSSQMPQVYVHLDKTHLLDWWYRRSLSSSRSTPSASPPSPSKQQFTALELVELARSSS